MMVKTEVRDQRSGVTDSKPGPRKGARTSRYRGVVYEKRRGKYLAQIIFNKQPRYLGRFDDEIEAAKAYDAAARELLGIGVTVNFPTEEEEQRAAAGAPPECPNLPEGMIEQRQALAMFDVAEGTFHHWEKKRWITCGRLVTVPGRPGRTKVYPPEELRCEVEALREGPQFPPPGYVLLEDAPGFFDVSEFRWREGERAGQLTTGELMTPKGRNGRKKVYPIEATRRQVEALKEEAAFPPPGFVDWDEAIRMAGVTQTKWMKWQREGRIRCGRWMPIPQPPGKRKAYPIEELRREIEEAQNPQFPPPGFVRVDDACAMLDVSRGTLSRWENDGRVRGGRMVQIPDQPGQVKIYPVDELNRLLEEFKTTVPFPPEGYVGREDACAMFGVGFNAWKKWEDDGRITCGVFATNPNTAATWKIYRVAELERLRAEFKRQEEEEAKRLEPYPDPDRPGCWRVPIKSRQHENMEAIIDEASLPLVQGNRWWWSPGDGRCGTVVLAVDGTPKPPLHQIIMGVQGPEHRVGHLNDDPLDCRRVNLVVRTHVEQAVAARKRTLKGGQPCSSRFKGVRWTDQGRKWVASITEKIKGGKHKRHQLGRFRSEIEAALAYDAAARELFGEHARLNLPDPAEVERLRALEPPYKPLYESFPPPGMVDRDDACQTFGVSSTTWTVWERNGRIRCGRYFPLPDDKPGRCKLYPVDELERLREEIGKLGKPYPDPDRPGCYLVPLKGYLEYREAMIDAESLPIVEGRNWNWSPRSDGTGNGQVILATIAGTNPPLARLIMGVQDWDERVTYANGNPLDCRRENLIVKTIQEQTFGNCKMGSVSGREYTSRYKGVSWDKEREKWLVQITRDRKYHHIGRFDSEIEAARAYDDAARELFGEFAWLNFPGQGERGLMGEATMLAAA